MPNGTYGGVRGGAGDDPTYSILRVGFEAGSHIFGRLLTGRPVYPPPAIVGTFRPQSLCFATFSLKAVNPGGFTEPVLASKLDRDGLLLDEYAGSRECYWRDSGTTQRRNCGGCC
jgi:hypothetical protein